MVEIYEGGEFVVEVSDQVLESVRDGLDGEEGTEGGLVDYLELEEGFDTAEADAIIRHAKKK